MSEIHPPPHKPRQRRSYRLASTLALAGTLLITVSILGIPGSGPAKAGDGTSTTIERPDHQEGANGQLRPS